MSKVITIKLTKSGSKSGPFNIYDQLNNIIDYNISKDILIEGVSYTVEDFVTSVIISSVGNCIINKSFSLSTNITTSEIASATYTQTNTSCLWRHLTNIDLYNSYYGITYPYIIEYPFAYTFNDEIVQSVKDYTRVYKYLPDGTGVFNYNDKIEIDDTWFNKSVIYNGRQSTGVLELVPKPIHNLKKYLTYPIYNTDSKVITYTKSDNFYNINTFWDIVKDKSIPLFSTSCEYLSLDKEVNQSNMNYGDLSFKKAPLRAKDSKVRYILDNRSDINLVSQFIIQNTMISYK